MKASIKDVARHAGVSTATVSRALNSPHLVRPDTQQAVERAIDTLQFRPNLVGRQLRTTRTGIIGVVLPTLSNPVFADCLQGIEEAAARRGYRVLVATTHYELERERQSLDTLLRQRVDGLILTVANADGNAMLARVRQSDMPYVLAYNHSQEHPCVTVANRLAAAEAVASLIALGHQRIAALTGLLGRSDRAVQRYAGYCDAMAAAGLEAAPAIEVDFNAPALPAPLLDRLAAADALDRPTALFCGNDHLAMLAMHGLVGRGVRVPGDLSIMGFDGLAFGQFLTPTLATVSQPSTTIGACALEALHERFGGMPAGRALILPHGLRQGGSVAAPVHP